MWWVWVLWWVWVQIQDWGCPERTQACLEGRLLETQYCLLESSSWRCLPAHGSLVTAVPSFSVLQNSKLLYCEAKTLLGDCMLELHARHVTSCHHIASTLPLVNNRRCNCRSKHASSKPPKTNSQEVEAVGRPLALQLINDLVSLER